MSTRAPGPASPRAPAPPPPRAPAPPSSRATRGISPAPAPADRPAPARTFRVCAVSAEVTPFAKTGGLGDVAGALTAHLAARGHDVRTFLPLYGRIDRERHGLVPVDFVQGVELPVGQETVRVSLWTGPLPDSGPSVYLVDCPDLFGGPEIYRGGDDDAVRYAVLGRAVLESCQRMGFAPDLFHLHDWHAAYVALLARTVYRWDELFRGARTVVTLHNVGFQGESGTHLLPALGLAGHEGVLRGEDLAAGRVNPLAAAIVHADRITTVSPTHAREIQTLEYGAGLDGLLRSRAGRLRGILNGIDARVWDPAADPYTAAPFDAGDPSGKAACRRDLLVRMNLPPDPGGPVLGAVSRLTWQKGFDLLAGPAPDLLAEHDVRLVVLGSGEPDHEALLDGLQRRFPGRVSFYRGFSEELAHLIVAGSDVLLVPSRYEPCGLTQMYALRYGTLPLVRATGGLADTVDPWQPGAGRGTGFAFEHFDANGLAWALGRMLEAWADRDEWAAMVARAMTEDHSWERRVGEYEELFAEVLEVG